MNIRKNYVEQHNAVFDPNELVRDVQHNVIETIRMIPKVYQSDIEKVLESYSFDEIEKSVNEYNNRILQGDVIEDLEGIRMLVVDVVDDTYVCLSGYNFEPVYINIENRDYVKKIRNEHKSIDHIYQFLYKSFPCEKEDADVDVNEELPGQISYEEILTKLP